MNIHFMKWFVQDLESRGEEAIGEFLLAMKLSPDEILIHFSSLLYEWAMRFAQATGTGLLLYPGHRIHEDLLHFCQKRYAKILKGIDPAQFQ